MCDFYFPKFELFLEIQGNWVHGFHPYEENNKTDQLTVESWRLKNSRYYEDAIKTWTISDVQKRQWAKDHNLNWIEVFSIKLDDVIDKIKDLI